MEVSAYAHQPSTNHSGVACGRYLSEYTCVERGPGHATLPGLFPLRLRSSFCDGVSAASRVYHVQRFEPVTVKPTSPSNASLGGNREAPRRPVRVPLLVGRDEDRP
jgi:hypothetical protein